MLYGIWSMVCGIWYENGIHSVFAYVSCASRSGCLQCSASIPCENFELFMQFCYTSVSIALSWGLFVDIHQGKLSDNLPYSLLIFDRNRGEEDCFC